MKLNSLLVLGHRTTVANSEQEITKIMKHIFTYALHKV